MYNFYKNEYDYSTDIDSELLPLSNEKRLEVIADAVTCPFNKLFNDNNDKNRNFKVKSFYDKDAARCYLLYSGCYIDFIEYAVTDLRWDIIARAIKVLEKSVTNQREAAAWREDSLNKEIDGEFLAGKLAKPFEVFDGLTEDEVIDTTARYLRGTLGESVEYGYDGKEREFFLNVPKYTKSVYIKHKYLRDHRWDILFSSVQLLEQAVNEEKEKKNVEHIN